MTGRPGLQEALQAVERGDAQALVVAKLDRLSRSLLDFASLMERDASEDGHWSPSTSGLIPPHRRGR